ncbi:MAG: hypothetical protein JWP81_2698 [Ferruginibacter sp.]|nr:hypothetical protein [Ferruginibacter sp.]
MPNNPAMLLIPANTFHSGVHCLPLVAFLLCTVTKVLSLLKIERTNSIYENSYL